MVDPWLTYAVCKPHCPKYVSGSGIGLVPLLVPPSQATSVLGSSRLNVGRQGECISECLPCFDILDHIINHDQD